MATTYTTNYNLGKQENHADKFDMDVITDNADKIDAALTGLQSGIDGKQAALTTEQLAAVNSGITSAAVTQIETNKNNILLLEQANGAKNQINIPDGTYTAGTSSYSVTNGAVTSTATDNTTHAVDLSIWTLKAGTYVFYDDSSDLSAVQYRIYQQSPDTRLTPAGQNPATFTLANDTVVYLSCYTFKTGTMTTRPMLMTKAMWDAGFTDYQPYALSNAELTAEVKPLAYSNPTSQSTDVTLQSGGYYKIGNSVTVCIRATVSNALAAWAPIFSGFPVPITDNSIAENSAVVAVTSNAGVGIGITKRGIMQGFDAIPAGTLLLNCTYLCS